MGNRIGDLYTDLRDGKMLLKLLEVLSGERLVCLEHLFNFSSTFPLEIDLHFSLIFLAASDQRQNAYSLS